MIDADMLLDAMGGIDPEAVLTAGEAKNKRPGWAVLGAAAFIAAAAVFALIIMPRLRTTAPVFRSETIDTIGEASKLYGGELLGENMERSGAEISGIVLTRRGDADISDTSGWATLTFTAGLDGVEAGVTCSFNVPEDLELPWEPTEVTEYNDTTVYLHCGPQSDEDRFVCEAVFTCQGVRYDLSARVRELEDIYVFIAAALGEAPDGEGGEKVSVRPFENLLGFEDYRVVMDNESSGIVAWHFMVEIDGEERCVAEAFGSQFAVSAYSVDLDGDGIPELVTNNVYGTGAKRVYVFKNTGGEVFRGALVDWDWFRELGFDMLVGSNRLSVESYDPESGEFTVTNRGRDRTVTETFTGLDHFTFEPFYHNM